MKDSIHCKSFYIYHQTKSHCEDAVELCSPFSGASDPAITSVFLISIVNQEIKKRFNDLKRKKI